MENSTVNGTKDPEPNAGFRQNDSSPPEERASPLAKTAAELSTTWHGLGLTAFGDQMRFDPMKSPCNCKKDDCPRCINYQNFMQPFWRHKGLCELCGNENVGTPRTCYEKRLCSSCTVKPSKKTQTWMRIPGSKERMTQYERRQLIQEQYLQAVQTRKALDLCIYCGENKALKGRCCAECSTKYENFTKRIRKKKKATAQAALSSEVVFMVESSNASER